MDPRKNLTTQLFLVNHPKGAICATVNPDEHWTRFCSMVTTTHVVSEKHFFSSETNMNASGYTNATDDGVTILPDGFYFYHPRGVNFAGFDVTDPSGKGGVLLMNDLVNNGGMIKPFPVDAFIDTRFAASLYSNEHEHVIVGVNLEHTKLFTYSMLLPTEHARAFRIAVSAKHESGSVGTCVYEVDANKGKKIAAMCSIQNERSPTLVIGFDTGEIIMGTVNDDQFDITMSLTKKIPSYFKRMQLLPTSTGLLLAHDPVYKIMRIWDMKKREHVEHFVEFVNLPAMHNLSISSDGKYLVGLDGKEAGNSDVIHCFKLPSFTQHKLKLQTPVEAFAVCQEGMVLVAMNSSHIDIAGTTILNIGTLDVLLKKSHEPIPLDKEQNKPAPEKAQHIGAFDAVKLLFHKDSKPSRDGDSDRRRLSK